MRASASATFRACLATFACAAFVVAAGVPGQAQVESLTPVTDAVLQNPDPADWLMWRRTLDSWGYSPLDQVTRETVGDLRMVWSRGLSEGSQQGTPLVYDGVMFMPNPRDVIQAIDAVTGDLIWEHRRERPDDLEDFVPISSANRNIAIYSNLIIDTSSDDHVFALDAATGRLVWETQILDYTKNPAHQTSGPVSGRRPRSPARDRTIRQVQQAGRRQWKKDSGYHQQARVENAFFRYKLIIGESLRARSRAGQETEAILACNILNQMTQLGRPASYAIGR